MTGLPGFPSNFNLFKSTLVDILRLRALHQGDQLAFIFLEDGEEKEQKITYRQLDRKARAIAAHLQGLNARDERILLLYPSGLDYIAAFYGSLYAGGIAVPAYPPDPSRLNRTLPRLQGIIKDAQVKFALTTQPILDLAPALWDQAPELKTVKWISTDNIDPNLCEKWQDPHIRPKDIVFLQYTSGSTAAPKGVMINYENLAHNTAYVNHVEGNQTNRVGVFWLPMYHDMGLIGGILLSMYYGNTNVLMSPLAFLQKPIRWLRAFTRYKGTYSASPNFGYELCVRKIKNEQLKDLDLSTWAMAYNGAEPIRYETIDNFSKTFAPCGFRPENMYPCYGLAEATLIASGGFRNALPSTISVDKEALQKNLVINTPKEGKGSHNLIGSGRAQLDREILIVNPETKAECSPNQVGEVWLKGPNIAKGYWNRPQETQKTFNAYVQGSGKGPCLRTGDLGFIKDGELFITGRLKDLIILTGQNHYAQDIELTVEKSHPSLRQGCGAAFAVEIDGEEQLVVVQEIKTQEKNNLSSVFSRIRRAVVESHDIDPYEVILLKPKSIFKTSSGKIQRHACREAFLAGKLNEFRI